MVRDEGRTVGVQLCKPGARSHCDEDGTYLRQAEGAGRSVLQRINTLVGATCMFAASPG